jgi:hypothetical protein
MATGPTGAGITMSGCFDGGAGGTGCGFTGACGGVPQAARRRATRANEAGELRGTLRRIDCIRTVMWILMLEVGAAFFLLVFIVWWTMFSGRPENRKRPQREEHQAPDEPPRKQQ